ncbi:Alpha/Beta hydrolase protein [Suillus subaureus]|uniref:Alpha/Beta hydrolase protein n=1 Tax=Suillus subaureus TaxID=48587 RepID=A0A9P7EGB8_9AGAM|nr:Alpha/Beta hydrolase protein [Suillus subaureus]KAG1820465.1 Alpha/Beta hydrolase protein [Suillus subaureus]
MSASHWGSPAASKRALLIHGLTASSQSWEGIAQLLVAEGFFVVAPNLLGHAWRRGTDYRISTLAEDLRPYFAMDMPYDVIIGHSLGGLVALSLFPYLPKTKETTVILVDPPLELTVEQFKKSKNKFLKEIEDSKTADEHMAEHPAWSRSNSILRALGVYMCDRIVVEGIFEHNTPWSFSGLLKNIPPHVKTALLVSDPERGSVCHLEQVSHDVKTKVFIEIGHWIQYECPDAIMDEVSLPRANL